LNIIHNKCDHLHSKSEYALVRYADDFVICAKSESSCIRAKSIINDWLSIRGLELSKEKTRILHINEGFDFLGFNIRQYNTNSTRRGVALLVKPSKDSIKSFKKRMSIEWKKSLSWNIDRIAECGFSKQDLHVENILKNPGNGLRKSIGVALKAEMIIGSL
ncbi:reverse transcriptase domain-containing protein, partial [Orientia tsutsugamushi]|uniref:reverse transcriptase domain-containing protein n=1 Tax=Orientia tsutsugamushi TaxID=784 RepID=UPI000ADB7183